MVCIKCFAHTKDSINFKDSIKPQELVVLSFELTTSLSAPTVSRSRYPTLAATQVALAPQLAFSPRASSTRRRNDVIFVQHVSLWTTHTAKAPQPQGPVAALLEAQLTLDGSSPESLTLETRRLLSPASPCLHLEASHLFTVSRLLRVPPGTHRGAESRSGGVRLSPAQACLSIRWWGTGGSAHSACTAPNALCPSLCVSSPS